MPKVPYRYEVNGKLVTRNGSLIPICSLSNCSLLPSLTVLISFSGACYYLSSTINPFLYSLLSVRFRRGFQDVLRRCSGRMPVGIGLVQGTIQDFFVRVSHETTFASKDGV